ncbi:lysozyme family protein [Streptococcus thoraltensis]|uniref:lysozyme family protein n=1 Tax=Streptococcus thoraltensis TaxID=55085 RepID=UPI000363096D|nr:lysozyme family protein [Streptococcus thoraltensis]MDY4761012.1 lysozyme family protein [Streptococcus thoraltensis]
MFKFIKRAIVIVVAVVLSFQLFKIHRDVSNVLSYRPMIEEILAENDSTTNEDLILAMIYTETKGQEADLMQSSESSTGVANSITDSRESVRQGITVLSDNLEKAYDYDTDAWTAVQAYNFGNSYINYVAKHGGENTIDLAKDYSKAVVAPSLGNESGDTYRYYNPVALFYGGGKLYRDGGNIYYAKQVQFNLFLIKVMSKF